MPSQYIYPSPFKNPIINGVFFRMAALLVVAIARYVASSRLALQKKSIHF
jgi:hypothetical protein